jgi:hypothetical protein
MISAQEDIRQKGTFDIKGYSTERDIATFFNISEFDKTGRSEPSEFDVMSSRLRS